MAVWIAARSSVPPLPRCCSIKRIASEMFCPSAGSEFSESTVESPANKTTLNKSDGLQLPNQIPQKMFGSIQRKTVHRAGNIYHKNVLSNGYVRARYPSGG